MPLTFHPGPGAILICDFTGFNAPEMVKMRPVVVVSPRRRGGDELVTVVPLSSKEPRVMEPWHHCLSNGAYPPARARMWVKADMVATVAMTRLDRVKVRERDGSRSYRVFRVESTELHEIRLAVGRGIGLIGSPGGTA